MCALQGDALHIGGYEVDPILLREGVARDFAFGLYELDWDVFGVHIEGAVNLIPKELCAYDVHLNIYLTMNPFVYHIQSSRIGQSGFEALP